MLIERAPASKVLIKRSEQISGKPPGSTSWGGERDGTKQENLLIVAESAKQWGFVGALSMQESWRKNKSNLCQNVWFMGMRQR